MAVLRICRRMGWSIEQQWDGLSTWEQNEWLAYDRVLLEQADTMRDALIDQKLYTPETFVALMSSRL